MVAKSLRIGTLSIHKPPIITETRPMKLRRPPLWRLLLPAVAFLALAVFALVTDEAFGYRRHVRMGGTGWRRIPRCASPFDYWANVVLCIECSGLFGVAGLARHAGLEAWLRNRPWRMVGLVTGVAVLVLALAFGAAAVLA
jgi:hypothetical protein